MKNSARKIVIVNQAANYLTVGFCNAFYGYFSNVVLVTGNIHVQGERLNDRIKVIKINRYYEKPTRLKYFSYLYACYKIYWLLLTKLRNHEVVFVSLPPMGYLLNLLVRNRFSMMIWDVYPDIFKITGMKETNPIYRFWSFLNRKSFGKAFKIFTIGERMSDLLKEYIREERIIIQPIWSIFQENLRIPKDENPFIKSNNLTGKFVVQYSGNIGMTHKVEQLIILAEMLKEVDGIVFQIIGRGSRVPYLTKLVKEKNLPNCFFLPFQTDDMFLYSLSAADLGVVILDETTSKGSVPSKSYNLMSLGIPSLYISASDSELYSYSQKYNHAKCFSEAELDMAKNFILELFKYKEKWKEMSGNAVKASTNFRRENAIKFVEKYIE